MKTLFFLLVMLVPLLALADGTPTIPATQTEVNAGVIHNKYVAPDTLKNWSGGGGGGGSQSPLTTNVNAAGFSGTNYGELAATNMNFSKLTPFVAPTAFGCVGNSRASGVSGDTFTNWFVNLMTNYIPASRIAGFSNAAVSGTIVSNYVIQYTNNIRPWFNSFPASTPKVLFVHDFFNDVNLQLPVQTTLNWASNLIVLAHADGAKICFTTTPGSGTPFTFEQMTNKVCYDNWVMTNQAIDIRINVSRGFRMEQNITLQNDNIHYTILGRDMIAGQVYRGLLQPQGMILEPSLEFHGTSGEFVDSTFGYGWRGLYSQVRLGSFYPGITFDAGNFGGAWLGMNAAGNGIFSLYTVSSSGNVNSSDRLDISTTAATFYQGVSAPGFVGQTNSLNTNSAPYRTVAPSGLNTIALNQGWTNNFNARADLILYLVQTNLGYFSTFTYFTNTVTGECWTNGPTTYPDTNYTTIVIPDISPGDFGSISNTSFAGSGTLLQKAWWKLK